MASVDWQSGKSHLECSKYMLDNEVNCDVNFRIGENAENIKAHKYTLSMRSAVFERMFNGYFCESQIDPVIPDVPSAAFKTVLRYCYYDSLDIEDDIALLVLYASTKYMLPLLEEAARKKLIVNLSGSNVWDVYRYAINVGDTTLLDGCHIFFQGNITPVKEALQTEAFLNIPHKVLLDFLHINVEADNVASLNADPINSAKSQIYVNNCGISISDIELFEACNAWAVSECLQQEMDPTGANKRTVLGECLFLIQFPTMLQKDLWTIVHPTGILTQTDIVNICSYIHQGPGSECQVDFPSRQRQFVVTIPYIFEITPAMSIVHIEPEVRVMLSRVWLLRAGSYKVTISDLTSDWSFSMKYDTRFQGNFTKEITGKRRVLSILDMKPQFLKPGTKYSMTAERTKDFESPNQKLFTRKVQINDLSPFKEVKIECDPTESSAIYALTFCLV